MVLQSLVLPYLVKWPVLSLQQAPENSVLAPAVLALYVIKHTWGTWIFLWVLYNVRPELWLQIIDLYQRNLFCKICHKKKFFGLKRRQKQHCWVIGQATAACCSNTQCFCLLLLCENCLFIHKKARIIR